MKSLTAKELKKVAKLDNDWKLTAKDTKLTKTYTFDKHIDALIFIARVTVNAEILKHHPDITFTYCKVKVTLTSHDIKALSKQDLLLMARIERLSTAQAAERA